MASSALDDGSLRLSAAGLLYTSAAVRELDARLMAADAATEGAAWRLMLRAGQAMFQHLHQRWPDTRHLVIYCGPGNNGGDGYVIAGAAAQAGLTVTLLQVGDVARATPETRSAIEFAQRAGVVAIPYQPEASSAAGSSHKTASKEQCVVVDALVGIGFRGVLQGDFALAVNAINSHGWPVMAVDIPSGLNPDTGEASPVVVRAALTVTVVGRKQGLYTGDAADYVGKCVYEPLASASQWRRSGCAAVAPSARLIDNSPMQTWVPRRRRNSHKGSYGQVLVVGGDSGMGGAPILAAEAAARAGAGKVTLLTRPEHVSPMLARQPEIMVLGSERTAFDSSRVVALVRAATVIVLGPGLGQSSWSKDVVQIVLETAVSTDTPLVLDADALNLMAEDVRAFIAPFSARARARWILTPHPGEAARLLGCTAASIQKNRFQAVRDLQRITGGNCLLKGAGSLLAFAAEDGVNDSDYQSLVDVCTEGNPGMASGGTGDVLAGFAGGLLAQGLTSADALRAAVCLHARAGDVAARRYGEQGLLASDLISVLGQIWAEAGCLPTETS